MHKADQLHDTRINLVVNESMPSNSRRFVSLLTNAGVITKQLPLLKALQYNG